MIKITEIAKIIILISLVISCEKNSIDISNESNCNDEDILFIRNDRNKLSEICTIEPDDTDYDVISHFEITYPNRGYMDAKCSPGKSNIVIVGGPESSSDVFPLWLINMNTGYHQKISNCGLQPLWMSDNEILYHKPRSYSISTILDIYIVDIKNMNEYISFIQLNEFNTIISYIDNYTTIGFLYDKLLDSTKYDIIVESQVGYWNNYKILYEGGAYRSVPSKLSPDRNKIYFVKGIYRRNDIYSFDLYTQSLVNLTNQPSEYRSFSLSPDGKYLAFSKEIQSSFCDIFIMDLETLSYKNITNSGYDSVSSIVMDWR